MINFIPFSSQPYMLPLKKLFFFSLLVVLFAPSCKKPSDIAGNPLLEQFFELNVLNREFSVTLATNDSSDLTPEYAGYTFVMQKEDYYHGPLKATKGSMVYVGTWSSNEDYSKLDITLPPSRDEFKFLTRAWRFSSKSFPTMKLGPWGSTAKVVLHMYRK